MMLRETPDIVVAARCAVDTDSPFIVPGDISDGFHS